MICFINSIFNFNPNRSTRKTIEFSLVYLLTNFSNMEPDTSSTYMFGNQSDI